MHRVLILGAGKIGALISGLLAESGSYRVQLADVDGGGRRRSGARARPAKTRAPCRLDATDAAAPCPRSLADHPVEAVISSLPYYCNVAVAEAARKARVHYFDLTEDVEVTRAVRATRRRRRPAPSSPNADSRPGFISIAAAELITHFDTLRARENARRRAAAAPEQRAEVLAHLVDRGTHQRVRQPLPGGRATGALDRGGTARRVSRRSRSTARSMRPSTPPAVSARSPRRTGRAANR